jgi:hypothetical protein
VLQRRIDLTIPSALRNSNQLFPSYLPLPTILAHSDVTTAFSATSTSFYLFLFYSSASSKLLATTKSFRRPFSVSSQETFPVSSVSDFSSSSTDVYSSLFVQSPIWKSSSIDEPSSILPIVDISVFSVANSSTRSTNLIRRS